MNEHHYLGFSGVGGRSIFYVATLCGQWVALLCWSSAALHVGVREDWLGWDGAVRQKRLPFIANNSRFLILPDVAIKNLASKVLSLNLARLNADWQTFHGSSIWLAETFVDPSRFLGTCYLAANWQVVGKTRGFSRVPAGKGFYRHNNQPKMYLAYPLVKNFKERLSDLHFKINAKETLLLWIFASCPWTESVDLFRHLKPWMIRGDDRDASTQTHRSWQYRRAQCCQVQEASERLLSGDQISSRMSFGDCDAEKKRHHRNRQFSVFCVQQMLRSSTIKSAVGF